ncbi:MAG: glycosyltransferase family 39 protein [Opitutaceae bacterium]
MNAPEASAFEKPVIVRPSIRGTLLLGGSAVVSLYTGFLYFDPRQSEWLVKHLGYPWMLALSLGWVAAVVVVARAEKLTWRKFWPGRGAAWLILIAWLWLLRMDPAGYKILYDEPVQTSTAFTLHQERELATTVRAYPLNGLHTVLTVYLDKRPPFFPFLVATVHDLTGYRVANAQVVNAAGTLVLLVLVWHLGRKLAGNAGGGIFAVAALTTFPTLGVMTTSAGMDLINLVLVAALGLIAVAYAQSPTPSRAAVFVLTTVLLAFTRYESALYVGAAVLVWMAVSWRQRTWLFTPIWALLPLALVLYGWHNTVLSNSPVLWELHENQTQRFSLSYAANNLRHAASFLFNLTRDAPNSVFLTVAGLGGAFLLLVQIVRRRSVMPSHIGIALGAVASAVFANFAILMCYYWGALDDPIVTRLSLPLHLLLAWLAVAGWAEWRALVPRWGTWRAPALAAGAAFLLWTVPAASQHSYTALNLLRKNFEWERTIVDRYWPAPDLIVTNRSPIIWLAECMPAIPFDRARARESSLRWHLERHSFNRVMVMQRVLTLGGEGGWAVDPGDKLPDNWRLQEIAVRRFGFTLTRVSRLLAIDEPVPPVASTLPGTGQ